MGTSRGHRPQWLTTMALGLGSVVELWLAVALYAEHRTFLPLPPPWPGSWVVDKGVLAAAWCAGLNALLMAVLATWPAARRGRWRPVLFVSALVLFATATKFLTWQHPVG